VSIKSPSLHLSREPLVSGLCCTALAIAFPFSLINPTLCTGLGSQVYQLPHEPVLWPVKARTLDISHWHLTKPSYAAAMYNLEQVISCLQVSAHAYLKAEIWTR
jgi:hypothetical protein